MRTLFVLALAIVPCAACGGGDEPRQAAEEKGITPATPLRVPGEPDTASPNVPVTDSAGDEAAAGSPGGAAGSPAREWTVGIAQRQGAGGVSVLRRVESARHDGYDRVVFEFEGEIPGYHIEYVDRPVRECGSGHEVDLPLTRLGQPLLVRLEPARAHTEEGQPTVTGFDREPRLPVLKELKRVCDFEAQVAWVLGLDEPNPYRVLELREPGRVVVDVRH